MKTAQPLNDSISKLKYLPESDKKILLEMASISYGHAQSVLPSLSIFKQNVTRGSLDDQEFVYLGNEEIYYSGFLGQRNLALFFDSHKKIVNNSRFYLTHLNEFISNIDSCLFHLYSLDLAGATSIGAHITSIEKWYITYGHFKDEAYSLQGLTSRLPFAQKYRPLLDYPTDTQLDTDSFKVSGNYPIIDDLIFQGRSINAYIYGDNLIKMSDLIVFCNGFHSKYFHSFPLSVSSQIKTKVLDTSCAQSGLPNRILLTRSSSYRDLRNKTDIENFFLSKGFSIVNPELVDYQELIIKASECKILVTYYGSALTNLAYFQPNTRVIILKSESYMQESIDLWSKVISSRKLQVDEVTSNNNEISIDMLCSIDFNTV